MISLSRHTPCCSLVKLALNMLSDPKKMTITEPTVFCCLQVGSLSDDSCHICWHDPIGMEAVSTMLIPFTSISRWSWWPNLMVDGIICPYQFPIALSSICNAWSICLHTHLYLDWFCNLSRVQKFTCISNGRFFHKVWLSCWVNTSCLGCWSLICVLICHSTQWTSVESVKCQLFSLFVQSCRWLPFCCRKCLSWAASHWKISLSTGMCGLQAFQKDKIIMILWM